MTSQTVQTTYVPRLLLLVLIAAQFADAITYAYGLYVLSTLGVPFNAPIDTSVVHMVFGPGATLAAKAVIMVGLVLGYHRWRWRWWLWKVAVVWAIALGIVGAAINTHVILLVTWAWR